MDTLDNLQSALLKRAFMAPIPYDSLTEEEKKICAFLNKLQYLTYNTTQKSRSFSGVFQVYDEITSVSISEKGKMYLVNERLSNEQRHYLKEQINSLREMADSAQRQADSAQKQADAAQKRAEIAIENAKNAQVESIIARRDALFAKIISVITILISIVSTIVSAIC